MGRGQEVLPHGIRTSTPTIPNPTTPSASSTGRPATSRVMEERAKLGMKPEENLNPKNKDQKKVCGELKVKNAPAIQEGIDSLNKAIQLPSRLRRRHGLPEPHVP